MKIVTTSFVLATALLSSAPVRAGVGDFIGTEFRVNTSTSYDQEVQGVSSDAAGNTLVVFRSATSNVNGKQNVNAQRYDRYGAKRGVQFKISFLDNNVRRDSAASTAPGGESAVAWAHGSDSNYSDIWLRFIENNGALSAVFRVNYAANDSGNFGHPAVALNDAGGVLVAFDGAEGQVYTQRYDGSMVRMWPNILVSTDAGSEHSRPSVALGADGRGVVSWEAHKNGKSTVWVQRISATGAREGVPFPVTNAADQGQFGSRVSMADDGSFIVSWMRWLGETDVVARRFNAQGVATGAVFNVTDGDDALIYTTDVALDAKGNATFSWVQTDWDTGDNTVMVRYYGKTLNPATGPIQVNSSASYGLFDSKVGISADSSALVAWSSNGQDGDALGVYAQRLSGRTPSIGLPPGPVPQ